MDWIDLAQDMDWRQTCQYGYIIYFLNFILVSSCMFTYGYYVRYIKCGQSVDWARNCQAVKRDWVLGARLCADWVLGARLCADWVQGARLCADSNTLPCTLLNMLWQCSGRILWRLSRLTSLRDWRHKFESCLLLLVDVFWRLEVQQCVCTMKSLSESSWCSRGCYVTRGM